MKNDCEPVGEKSEQIIKAAIIEFQQQGFAQANMDRITVRAGVSKRTLYKYFESKKNLFDAICVRLSMRVSRELDVPYVPGEDIRTQLTRLGEAEGRVVMSEELMGLARLVLSQVLRHPEIAAEMQGKLDMSHTAARMIRAASAEGALQCDAPEDAARTFLALIKAKAFWPVIFGEPMVEPTEMKRIIENAVEMIMSRYGPR